jgi:ADP-ribosyl-[dinitrogen reductase] hydrolase
MRSDRQDRMAGVLLGQAAGDALGSPYEFREPPAYGQARFGVGTFGFGPGEYTDDSQQAVCVAVARSEPLAVAAGLLSWYAGNPRDVGNQTAAVLSRVKTPRGMAQVSKAYARRQAAMPKPAHWDPGTGNGSLMRTGPVCLPMLGDRERIATVARKISDLTHADPYSGDACFIWSLAIDSAIRLGGDFTLNEVRGGLVFIPAERRKFWREVIVTALSGPQPSSQNGSAVGAFRCALWAVSHAGSLEDGLQRVVSIGGDADTTGAIAGALLGAMHGASAVPAQWRKVLHGWPGMKAGDLEELALQAAGMRAAAALRPV